MAKRKLQIYNQNFALNRYNTFNLQIGSYYETKKSKSQLDNFDKSINLYDQKRFFESFESYFMFLKNKSSQNISYTVNKDFIDFEFSQGSKLINGKINRSNIDAHSEVFEFENLTDELALKLLKINYELNFCKFCIENKKILCKINIHTTNAHPHMLHLSLKELALTVDKYDDLLFEQFPELKRLNFEHIKKIPIDIVKKKIKYLRKWVETAIEDIEKLDNQKMSGARAYVMMGTFSKIAYLIAPQGVLKEELKRVFSIYFSSKTNIIETNSKLYNELKKISYLSDKALIESFYKSDFTFSPLNEIENEKIIRFISTELDKVYILENIYKKDVREKDKKFDMTHVFNYIVGYIQNNQLTSDIWDDLLQIYWEVMYSEFFEDFNVSLLPIEKDKIKISDISFRIRSINLIAKKEFKNFFFNVKHLNADNRIEFAKSFLQELITLDFSNETKKMI